MCKEAVRRLLQSAHDALFISTSATLSAEDDAYDADGRDDGSADFAMHRKMYEEKKAIECACYFSYELTTHLEGQQPDLMWTSERLLRPNTAKHTC